MRRGVAVLGLLTLAVVLAWTARSPEAGAAWRWTFVAVSVLGAGGVWIAIRAIRPSASELMLVALGMRVILLPLEPTLSTDGNRYLWDGAVVLSGQSPYELTPREAIENGFTPPVPLASLNSPDYHSVYPPTSQLGFAGSVWLAGGEMRRAWWIWKSLLVLIELGGIFALTRIVSPIALAFYAWHPVSIVEGAGQGHTEALALGLIALGLAAALRQRLARAGGLWALAGWVKLWPFALFGLWRKRRGRLWGTGAVVAGSLALMFTGRGVAEGIRSLGLYAGTFDFYSAPYLILKSVLWPLAAEASGQLASIVLALCILLSGAVIAFRDSGKSKTKVSLWLLTVTVLSTTLHPWHLLPALLGVSLLSGGAFQAAIYWLVTWSSATYLIYVGQEWVYPYAVGVGWVGAAMFAGWATRGWISSMLLRWRGVFKWRRVRGDIPFAASILDYGAAEGFVGLAASSEGHIVTLSDRVDASMVDLPFVRCGDRTLPLSTDSVDVTLLIFVLHHATSAEAVLSEAIRVTRTRVIVWETVPSSWMTVEWLERLDGVVNRQRPGEEPLAPAQLRTVPKWEHLFHELGLQVIRRERWGHVHPQALWVLERG